MDDSSSSSHMDEESLDGSEREYEYDLDEVEDDVADDDEEDDSNAYGEDDEDPADEVIQFEGSRLIDLSSTLHGVVSGMRWFNREPRRQDDGMGLGASYLDRMTDDSGDANLDAGAIISTAWDMAMGAYGSDFLPGAVGREGEDRLHPSWFNTLERSGFVLPSQLRGVSASGHGPSLSYSSSPVLPPLTPTERTHPMLRRRNIDRANPAISLHSRIPSLSSMPCFPTSLDRHGFGGGVAPEDSTGDRASDLPGVQLAAAPSPRPSVDIAPAQREQGLATDERLQPEDSHQVAGLESGAVALSGSALSGNGEGERQEIALQDVASSRPGSGQCGDFVSADTPSISAGTHAGVTVDAPQDSVGSAGEAAESALSGGSVGQDADGGTALRNDTEDAFRRVLQHLSPEAVLGESSSSAGGGNSNTSRERLTSADPSANEPSSTPRSNDSRVLSALAAGGLLDSFPIRGDVLNGDPRLAGAFTASPDLSREDLRFRLSGRGDASEQARFSDEPWRRLHDVHRSELSLYSALANMRVGNVPSQSTSISAAAQTFIREYGKRIENSLKSSRSIRHEFEERKAEILEARELRRAKAKEEAEAKLKKAAEAPPEESPSHAEEADSSEPRDASMASVPETGGSNISQIVEERAASLGVSLEAPANDDPDVLAAAVAHTGIDPTFLAALPEDMRSEILTQHFEQVTSARAEELAGSRMNSTTILAQEFLVALPPSLRSDVLAQEANYRSRHESRDTPSRSGVAAGSGSGVATMSGGQSADAGAPGSAAPAEADLATFFASLNPELREEILMTSGEALVAQLPPHVAQEARALRERESSRPTATMWPSPEMSVFRRDSRLTGPNGSSSRTRPRVSARFVNTGGVEQPLPSAAVSWTYEGGRERWVRTVPGRSIDPRSLCDELSVGVLVQLLRVQSTQYGNSLLHCVLAYVCKRRNTRRQLLELLFGLLPVRESGGSSSGKVSGAKLARPGGCGPVATDAVVIRRVLEVLTNLCKHEEYVREDLVAVPCDHVDATGIPSFHEAHCEEWSAASALLGLLGNSLFKRSSVHLEQLLSLLHLMFTNLPPEKSRPKLPRRRNDDGTFAEPSPADQAPTESRDPVEDASQSPTDPVTGTEKSSEETGKLPPVIPDRVPIEFRVPRVREGDLLALSAVLQQEDLSDKTYEKVTTILGRVGMLEVNRERSLRALSTAASGIAAKVASSFGSFVQSLPHDLAADKSGDGIQNLESFSMAASADELKLLRVAKAISVLLNGSGNEGDDSAGSEASMMDEVVAQSSLSSNEYMGDLDSLWQALDMVLDKVRVYDSLQTSIETGATPSGRLEAEVERRTAASRRLREAARGLHPGNDSDDDDEGDGDEAEGSGKPHSLSPALARLSPIIESFFVYHGSRVDDSSSCRSPMSNASLPQSPADAGLRSARVSNSEDHQDGQHTSADELGNFVKRHRVAINSILRGNPQLLDGSFRPALRHAHAIDFDNKKSYFRGLIRKRGSESHAGTIRIAVRRDRVFEDSYQQLRSQSVKDMRGRLHVQFSGEEGIDAGGVTREWYVILARQIFDPNYALFCRSAAKAATYQPNKSSFVNQEHLDNFRFVGRIFGKAIYDGQLLDAYFTRAFYKHILGIRPTYHDIEAEDPDYYKSLCWILDNDITDIIEETFCTEYEEFGSQRVVDLKPNGRNIPVTQENKVEYVRLVTEVKLTKAIEKQIAAFKEGFHELIPLEDCRIFNEVELELLTSGLPDIDVADLKANVEYTGYTAGSAQIVWFWNAVGNMGQEDLARLVMFVTGTSKVPLEGFAALQGMNGLQKFQIHRAHGEDKARLPSAHTCFNQLDLPEYESCEVLTERLLRAIRETVGFGFS